MRAVIEKPLSEALVRKLLFVVDEGLVVGLGRPRLGEFCVEAAANYALGEPHGDMPTCVGDVVRMVGINLNDRKDWILDKNRSNGLRRFAVAQLGSNNLDQAEFTTRFFKWFVTATADVVKEYTEPAFTVCDMSDSYRCLAQTVKDQFIKFEKAVRELDVTEFITPRHPSEDDQVRFELSMTKRCEEWRDVLDPMHLVFSRVGKALPILSTNIGFPLVPLYALTSIVSSIWCNLSQANMSAEQDGDGDPALEREYLEAAIGYIFEGINALGLIPTMITSVNVDAVHPPDWNPSKMKLDLIRRTAEAATQILIEMKSPGCEYLYLTENQ